MGRERSPRDVFKLSILLILCGFVSFILYNTGWKLLFASAAVVATAGAAAAGARVIGKLMPNTGRLERTVFGAGLGLGALSTSVLAAAHVSTRVLPWILAVCAAALVAFRKELVPPPRLPRDGFSRCILAILFVAGLLNLSACFMPPLDYDVTEYHLGAPAEYIRDGQMHFLPHNVYASLPGNVEMLYLLALSTGEMPFDGACMAKTFNLCLLVLSAAAVYMLGRRLAGEKAGLIAAAAFYVHPIAVKAGIAAYVEGGLVFYTVSALYAAVAFAESGSRRWAALAGISAGLAAGCKYPAVLFVAIPVLVYIAFARGTKRDIVTAGLAAVCCAAAFAPWAVRNIVNTGNPVYPLAWGVFGGSNWNEELNARFIGAHDPPGSPGEGALLIREGKEYLRRLLEFFRSMKFGSPLILIFVPVAFLMKIDKRVLLLTAGYFLICFTIWFFATHRIDRFLAGSLPALCILAGSGVMAGSRRSEILKAAAVVCLLVSVTVIVAAHISYGVSQTAMAGQTGEEWLREFTRGKSYSHTAVSYMNNLPQDARILLVGEAEIYYFNRRIIYSVVFNDDIIEKLITGGPAEVRRRLAKEGVTHVFVNWPELWRLRRTYSYEYNGRTRPGYLPHMSDWEILRFTRGLTPEISWGAGRRDLGHREWELYTVGRNSS